MTCQDIEEYDRVAMAKATHTFSISEAIHYAWQTSLANIWFFIPVTLIPWVISWAFSFASGYVSSALKNNGGELAIVSIVLFLASWIISTEFSFAKLIIYLKVVDEKKPDFQDLFSYFDAGLLWRYFCISALFGLVVLIGLVLFIVPGIYFYTKYWFALYIYADKKGGIMEAFAESAKLTDGVKMQLFFLGIVQLLIVFAGLLALFVGLFVAIPMNYLSDFYVYRKLQGK